MSMDREGESSRSCYYFGTSTGSRHIFKDKYYYDFFNAALKLPAHFTSGVVVSFNVSFIYAPITSSFIYLCSLVQL
ncbi:hypothetical protein P3S67_015767 [Capsicum chacoense]